MTSLLSTIKSVKLDDLIPHPRNPRQGDISAIAESLEANGQFRPILVQRSTNHVLAGNHTLAAARQLGWEKVSVTFVDVDDDQAVRILLADNRTSELGVYDEKSLAELLSDLEGFQGTGFDDDYVSTLLARFEPPTMPSAPAATEEPEEDDEDGEPEVEAPPRNWVGHFMLVFDTEEQRMKWNDFVRALRGVYPDAETNTERLMLFIDAHTPEVTE